MTEKSYPTWIKVVGYACRTIIITFIILICYTFWFVRGKPTISIDYVTKFNEMARPVADESLNAAPYYLKAIELYVEPEEEYDWHRRHKWNKFQQSLDLKSKPQELQVLTKWLQANRPAVEELRLATAKPHCWFKYEVGPHSERRIASIIVPPLFLNGSMQITNVLSWQMQFAAERGSWNLFAADMKSVKTLARHLMQCPFLIEQFEGQYIDQLAHRQLIQVLRRYSLPPSALQRLAQALDESFPSGYPIADISFESLGLLDAAQRVFTDDGSGDGHFIPSAAGGFFPTGTIDNTRGYYYPSAGDPFFVARTMIHPSRRETVEIIKQCKKMQDSYRLTTPYQDYVAGRPVDVWFRRTIEENPRNLFIKTLLPATQRAVWYSYTNKAKHQAAQTVVALLRYKAEHNEFPDSLEQLIPEYLKAVPLDPFGPGPLTYKRKDDEFILYSWGLNFEDHGGQHNPDVFRMRKAKGDYVFWPPAD